MNLSDFRLCPYIPRIRGDVDINFTMSHSAVTVDIQLYRIEN